MIDPMSALLQMQSTKVTLRSGQILTVQPWTLSQWALVGPKLEELFSLAEQRGADLAGLIDVADSVRGVADGDLDAANASTLQVMHGLIRTLLAGMPVLQEIVAVSVNPDVARALSGGDTVRVVLALVRANQEDLGDFFGASAPTGAAEAMPPTVAPQTTA